MKLVLSTTDFKIFGTSYPGFPLVLDKLMNIHWHIFEFLICICITRGTVNSVLTWEQYGRAMYDFFSFCEANGHDWTNTKMTTDHSITDRYYNWSISECGLLSSTVNDRLSVIYRFYEHALAVGWISSLPWLGDKPFLKDQKAGLIRKDTSGGDKSHPSSGNGMSTTVKILSRTQIDVLMDSIFNIELKLITRLGLGCGLRKEELLTFPYRYVVNPDDYPRQKKNYRIMLRSRDMKLKGKKDRQIDIAAPLMKDLWNYIKFDRQIRAALAIDEADEKILFLTEDGRRFANGGRGLNRLYNQLNLPFKVYPHILRHTYATHTLYVMRKMDLPLEPLIYIRDRLGHSSILTTEVYLHFIELVDDKLLDTLQNKLEDYYQEVAREAA